VSALFTGVPALSPGQASDPLPLVGPPPALLSAAVPGAAADWWQDMGYDLGGEEEFSMDLDAHLNMAGLDALPDLQTPGEGFGDLENADEN